MAGPAKRRARAEKKKSASGSSDQQSSGDRTQHSTPVSISRMDGGRDSRSPGVRAPVEYSRPNDMKSLSEFLSTSGWFTARGLEIPESIVKRPKGLNKFGTEALINLNMYNLLSIPSKVVHQYDISWGPSTDSTKRVLIRKIWESKAVEAALGVSANRWIYDGNKLAWCGVKLPRSETCVEVDLDQEQNRRPGRMPNKHRIVIRWTRQIDFSGLQAFLNGQASWSPECIDTINFLDHVLQEQPSQLYTQIKKSFFQRGEQRFDLGGGVEALKGVFTSLRPIFNNSTTGGLAINVDVANGTFWRKQNLGKALCQAFNCNAEQLINRLRTAHAKGDRDYRRSQIRKDLARFKRVGVSSTHIKNPSAVKGPGTVQDSRPVNTRWTIKEIHPFDAYNCAFPDPDNEGQQITIAQYFRTKYGITLLKGSPVAEMTKQIRRGPVYLPVEYLEIDENQRYNSKLSDTQTSQMIRFAVTLPAVRQQNIQNAVNLLNWGKDVYLKHYGVAVNPKQSKVKARILPVPNVHFDKGGKLTDRDCVQGRWRLDGKRFIQPNTRPIDSWGVCVVTGRYAPNPQAVGQFIDNFIRIYESHGGRFNPHPQLGKRPCLFPGNPVDAGEMIAKAFNNTGNKFNRRPMFMIFIVNDKNVDMYRRIKKSCDCRFGVPSQVLQAQHVQKNQAQYISNVCMKVNAKLGGATAFTTSKVLSKCAPSSDKIPTMVIGADVSHPAPGAGSDEKASFAAITVSADKTYTRYNAQCDTNGCRVEMVTTKNWDEHFGDMAKTWMAKVGGGNPPSRVLYIRDGVSEGQYPFVLEQEVRDIKAAFKKIGAKSIPDIAVVVAGKRHHVRFFPDQGDRNGNPLPGTLVETGCTNPFEFDFYLCSHVAIKGTARPVHYHCILNEKNRWQPAELQSFLFEHSFQYVRSTTPVSMHPAVYYAHLAADRSRAHQIESPVSSGKKEQRDDTRTDSGSGCEVEVKPLMALNASQLLKETMWFV